MQIRSSAKFEYRFVGGNRQGTGKETAVSEAHQRTAFEKDDPDDKGASKSLIENQPTIVQITPNVGENVSGLATHFEICHFLTVQSFFFLSWILTRCEG